MFKAGDIVRYIGHTPKCVTCGKRPASISSWIGIVGKVTGMRGENVSVKFNDLDTPWGMSPSHVEVVHKNEQVALVLEGRL